MIKMFSFCLPMAVQFVLGKYAIHFSEWLMFTASPQNKQTQLYFNTVNFYSLDDKFLRV